MRTRGGLAVIILGLAIVAGAVTTWTTWFRQDLKPRSNATATAVGLPACPDGLPVPTTPMKSDWSNAAMRYLLPRSQSDLRYPQKAVVLDVESQRIGTHPCVRPGGSVSTYQGLVPESATAAVSFGVRVVVDLAAVHTTTSRTRTDIVTLAKMSGYEWQGGWRVVAVNGHAATELPR